MSSVAQVQPLTRDLGNLFAPNEGWKVQVSTIHRKLTDPQFEWAIKGLTWSRVKKWFFGEHSRIDFDHMIALRELKSREEARREHNAFVAATSKMAALLSAEGASLSRNQMEALARIAGRSAHVPGDPDEGSSGAFRSMAGAGSEARSVAG